MYQVELYLRVRRACMVDGMSTREASRVFGLHRDTVRKPPRRPKIGPYTGVIHVNYSCRFLLPHQEMLPSFSRLLIDAHRSQVNRSHLIDLSVFG